MHLTYNSFLLQSCKHNNQMDILLPNEAPEIGNRWLQRTLSCYVFILRVNALHIRSSTFVFVFWVTSIRNTSVKFTCKDSYLVWYIPALSSHLCRSIQGLECHSKPNSPGCGRLGLKQHAWGISQEKLWRINIQLKWSYNLIKLWKCRKFLFD